MIVANNGSFPWRGLPLEAEWQRTLEGAGKRGSGGAPSSGDAASLKETRDRLIGQALLAQEEAGCDLLTDGRIGCDDPGASTIAGLDGIETGPERTGYPAGGRSYRVPVVRKEVAWTGALVAEDYLFATRGAGKPVKPILTGPFTLAVLAEDHAYGDPMTLAMSLATALNQELRALQAAGAGVIQIDEPGILTRAADFPIFTRVWEVLGRGVSSSLTLHLEGGSIEGVWPSLLRLKRLGCLSVDCVTDPRNLDLLRQGTWPDGLSLGLGLVGGEDAGSESARDVAERVRAAPGLPAPSRVVLGTGPDLGRLDAKTAAARLKALAGARRILDAA
jgi:5-methyltetrahydropteroyltriglutamate--homocysteine methyltransferase